jgi:hypothetical protein
VVNAQREYLAKLETLIKELRSKEEPLKVGIATF